MPSWLATTVSTLESQNPLRLLLPVEDTRALSPSTIGRTKGLPGTTATPSCLPSPPREVSHFARASLSPNPLPVGPHGLDTSHPIFPDTTYSPKTALKYMIPSQEEPQYLAFSLPGPRYDPSSASDNHASSTPLFSPRSFLFPDVHHPVRSFPKPGPGVTDHPEHPTLPPSPRWGQEHFKPPPPPRSLTRCSAPDQLGDPSETESHYASTLVDSSPNGFSQYNPPRNLDVAAGHTTPNIRQRFFFDSPTEAPSESDSLNWISATSAIQSDDIDFKWAPFIQTEPRTDLGYSPVTSPGPFKNVVPLASPHVPLAIQRPFSSSPMARSATRSTCLLESPPLFLSSIDTTLSHSTPGGYTSLTFPAFVENTTQKSSQMMSKQHTPAPRDDPATTVPPSPHPFRFSIDDVVPLPQTPPSQRAHIPQWHPPPFLESVAENSGSKPEPVYEEPETEVVSRPCFAPAPGIFLSPLKDSTPDSTQVISSLFSVGCISSSGSRLH